MNALYFTKEGGRKILSFPIKTDERISKYRGGWLLKLPKQDAIYFRTLTRAEKSLCEYDAAVLPS